MAGFVGTAAAANTSTISSCTVIDEAGTYELTGDVTNSTAEECIRISASDVTLDGMGHTIDGVDDIGPIGVYVHDESGSLTNVTVTNLTVTDWYEGVTYENVRGGHVEAVTASDNDDYGVVLEDTNATVVADVTAANNDFAGIGLERAFDNTVRDVTVTDNSHSGIYLTGSRFNALVDVTTSGNDYGVMFEGSGNNVLRAALATNNSETGVTVEGSPNTTLVGVTATDNDGFGIGLSGAYNTTIRNSTVAGNAGGEFLSVSRTFDGGRFPVSSTTTAENLTVGSTQASFTSKDVALSGVDSPPAVPTGYHDVGSFLEVKNTSGGGGGELFGPPPSVSELNLSVPYTSVNVTEPTLSLWRFNETSGNWTEVDGSTVDVDANTVSGNLTTGGIVAPLGKDITAPVADAGPNRTVVENTVVSFDGSNSSDNGQIVSYEWEFGDGANATGATPTHAYAQLGTYAVNLTVTDAAGNNATDSLTVTVQAASGGGGGSGDDDDDSSSTGGPTASSTGSASASVSSVGRQLTVSIENAEAGDTVTVQRNAEEISDELQRHGIVLESVETTFTDATDLDVQITASNDEPDPSIPDPPSDPGAVGYVDVDHSAGDDVVGEVLFGFRVTRERLNAAGIGTDEVVLHRYGDAGEWTVLETELVGTAEDGSLRFRAVSPGLSVFAIAGSPAQQTTPDGATTPEPDTPTPDVKTADPPGTEEPSTSTTPGQPGFGFAIALLTIAVTGLLAARRRS